MKSALRTAPILVATLLSACDPGAAQGAKPPADTRAELVLPGPSFFPEGIAAASDGTFYVSSIGTGAIVRFAPGAAEAETFVDPQQAFGVYGMVVDEERDLLWACTYDDRLAPAQPAHLKAYDLGTGDELDTYEMPGESGFCNDLILDDEGNVYATDSLANTIVRLPAGGAELETWAASDAFVAEPWDFTLNGIVYDGHDRLYVVKYATGELFSVRIQADGTAGEPEAIAVDPPLQFPDGLEIIGDKTLLVVENDVGQVSTVRLTHDGGEKTVVAGGLAEPTTAAFYNHDAWVVEGQLSYLYGGPGKPTLPFRVRRVTRP